MAFCSFDEFYVWCIKQDLQQVGRAAPCEHIVGQWYYSLPFLKSAYDRQFICRERTPIFHRRVTRSKYSLGQLNSRRKFLGQTRSFEHHTTLRISLSVAASLWGGLCYA